MTLALEFQAYKGKAEKHITNLEQLLKSKEQPQVAQGGGGKQRIAELEAQLASASKKAVSEYSLLMKKLADTTAAANTSHTAAQQRISDLEQQLERQGLASEKGSASSNDSIAKLQQALSAREKENKLLQEKVASAGGMGGVSDELLLQRLTDLQRQYALLEAQNNEMGRKLWTMDKAAEDNGKKEPTTGSGATKDPLVASRDVDAQSTFSENAENQSLLSATAEDYNQTEFASSAPSPSLLARKLLKSTQPAMYDLRKNGSSVVGGTNTSSSSSVGSGVAFPAPTPNNTPAKSATGSTSSDPIGSFFNMFGHGSG